MLDDFQTEAWQYLNANPDQVFAKTALRDGREIVRVAIADKMVAQTCVACHNSHPDTPKVGWRVGDVRGILEVATAIEPSLLAGQELSQAILLMIVIAGGFLILVTVAVARSVFKPLNNLTGAMNRISSGDELTEIPDYGDGGEIGQISKALQTFRQTSQRSD